MNIEELAFKDRKILANLNAIDLLDIIEFLQNDRKQWINQFTKTHNESVEIQKENQKLKKQLDEYENEPLTNRISRIDCIVSNIYSQNKIQQKEFINYLEDMLDDENDIFSVVRVKDALSKYKEIIGDDK